MVLLLFTHLGWGVLITPVINIYGTLFEHDPKISLLNSFINKLKA